MQKSRTYLVLGANGFIGSYLVNQLASLAGSHVKAFDRFSRTPTFHEKDNIEIIKGDIFKDKEIEQAIQGSDYLIHSFSATTPFISDNDPYIDVTSNLLRSIRVFELCAHHNVKKIGFVSSGGAVYGSGAEAGIVDETTIPLPVSPYGINKLAIEHYLEYFKRKYGLDYIIYRPTNPYGPGQRANKNQGVIPIFLSKINHKEAITVYGDGTASRDYIYIEDAARMIAKTFEKDNQHAVYNIGSGQQITINHILEAIGDVIDTNDITVTYKDAPATFLQKTQVSIERFKEEFGEPSLTPFEEGLRRTIEFQK